MRISVPGKKKKKAGEGRKITEELPAEKFSKCNENYKTADQDVYIRSSLWCKDEDSGLRNSQISVPKQFCNVLSVSLGLLKPSFSFLICKAEIKIAGKYSFFHGF